jgi:hypothetical protein
VCVERRMHGSVGGVGPSSREAVRAYPTETPASAARGARRVKPDPAFRGGAPVSRQSLQRMFLYKPSGNLDHCRKETLGAAAGIQAFR